MTKSTWQEKREWEIQSLTRRGDNVERHEKNGALYLTWEETWGDGVKLLAASFIGKAYRKKNHYYYSSREARAKAIRDSYRWVVRNRIDKRNARAAKKAFVHSLKVGDILYSSWGYEQTNIDFYQVVEVVGKQTVKIREIAGQHVEGSQDSWCSDEVKPVPDAFLENAEVLTKRVNAGGKYSGEYVSIASYASASKIENPETATFRRSWGY